MRPESDWGCVGGGGGEDLLSCCCCCESWISAQEVCLRLRFAPHKGLCLISDRKKRNTSRAGSRLIPAVSLRLGGICALPPQCSSEVVRRSSALSSHVFTSVPHGCELLPLNFLKHGHNQRAAMDFFSFHRSQ